MSISPVGGIWELECGFISDGLTFTCRVESITLNDTITFTVKGIKPKITGEIGSSRPTGRFIYLSGSL